ncbi:MAG: formylglycine-generating enzyme family protein [Gammaproteobacteria bacterium]|nr:MAG: formylglycine-generating enzyme family protein [Gammaproteobacteria bacterium]
MSKSGMAPILFLLVLCFDYLTTPVVQADSLPEHHRHEKGQCLKCHKQEDIQQLATADQGCLRCHGIKTVSALMLASSSPSVDPGESELSKFAPEKPIRPEDGMRFPQYNAKSRLGDAPNKMVLIPAGPFIRGTNDRLPDEGPQHTLSLPDYLIDIFEVTNLQYKRFIDETGRRSPDHFRNRTYPAGKADHPVTYVTWKDAHDYCQWAGKRLPTDAEWEKAARGTDGRIFPWGNDFSVLKANTPVRWQALKTEGDTTPVGSFEEGVSPYGLYDMTGNVWEWTASWYQPYPGNTTPSENYGKRYKTLKGGSWFDCSFYKCGLSAPLYNRSFFSVRTKNDTFGFRCAKDAPLSSHP